MRSLLRRWLGGGAAREVQASLDQLAEAVRALETANRKQAEQLKKLRDSQQAADARWQAALERWQHEAAEARRRDAHQAQARMQEQWQRALQAFEGRQKTEQKWRVIFSRQVDAVLRHLHLARLPLPQPYDLTARRFRLRSQNEEDGIVLALLERAGWTDRRFVEIGSGRSGGNAALLAYECGWSGVMFDIDAAAVDGARWRFRHNPGVVAVAAAVTPANVNQLLADAGFAGQVDLLSIDIDSFDYWVLDALEVCSPRLLMLEYNAAFGAERAVTIPLDHPLSDAPKAYRGASLAALAKAAGRKGYRLVACEQSGVNAFFLRHDVAPDVPAVPVAQAFRPAQSRLDTADSAGEAGEGFVPSEAYPLVEV